MAGLYGVLTSTLVFQVNNEALPLFKDACIIQVIVHLLTLHGHLFASGIHRYFYISRKSPQITINVG